MGKVGRVKGMGGVEVGIDEASARRILLAEAIDTADAQGKLLSALEREQIDHLTLQSSRNGAVADAMALLDRRAQRMLEIVHLRNPAIAALQQPQGRQRWLAPGALLVALVLGALGDRALNPHRLDLLSLPLLGLVAWNIGMYLLLIAGSARAFAARAGEAPAAAPQGGSLPPLYRAMDTLRGWRRRSGRLQAGVAEVFYQRWHAVAGALAVQRTKKVLHLAAVGWALGVMLSLLVRGLVVEYRVGWESTFLDAQQVYTVLRVLFAPVAWLSGSELFTVQEIAALQFGQGTGAAFGARWVQLHCALLALVVVLPRLMLAGLAWWNEKTFSGSVALDLSTPYFRDLLARLRPARLRLGLAAARDEDRAVLLHVLRSEEMPAAEPPTGEHLLLRTDGGDELWLVPRHPRADSMPAPEVAGNAAGAVLPAPGTGETSPTDSTALATLGRQLSTTLRQLIVPVSARTDTAAPESQCDFSIDAGMQGIAVSDAAGHLTATLRWAEFARCWVQHGKLFDALAQALPAAQRPALQRLARTWSERARERLRQSMQLLATHLVEAARANEEARSAWSVTGLVSPAGRRAANEAREAAMGAVATRIAQSAARAQAALRQLHGLHGLRSQSASAEERPEESLGEADPRATARAFAVRQAVHAPQAGIAGAATGAAMGASVDLAVGGLTLGAAAALGALAGGGIAWATAAWRNRSAPSGATLVQAGDEMLQALAEQALHGYLVVIHSEAAASGDGEPAWPQTIHAVVQAHRDRLQKHWERAREDGSAGGGAAAVELLATAFEAIALEVLGRLYPGTAIKEAEA